MRRIELPTLLLAITIYAAWLALTWAWASLPLWLLPLAGGWVLAWHGSLQHEAIHGHPTRSPGWNALLAGAPLGLWLPYPIYRQTHLRHHQSELTDPGDDPESFYLDAQAWAGLGPLGRALRVALQTGLGRLLLGPPVVALGFLAREAARLARGEREHATTWAKHLLGAGAVVGWLELVCELPLWLYLLTFVYPGLSLTLLRSYVEHRPAAQPEQRTAIVEARLLGWLFLHNNLHVIHHDEPGLAWYRIPARYRARRAEVLAQNGGYRYRGYPQVLARHLLRPKDAPLHPAGGAS